MILEPVDRTASVKRPAEFRSELENLMPAKELSFEATPGFGKYRRFLDHAVAHPAKINQFLLEYLILTYTREGDTILDPMAGTGSTGVQAALNGRNAVCVDIEEKFYQWMEQARKGVEASESLNKKGWIRNICGDSRNLSALIQRADSVITSPPYVRSIHDTGQSKERVAESLHEKGYSDSWIKAHYSGPACQVKDRGYSGNPMNIGNLEHVDAVVTSPPYADTKPFEDIKSMKDLAPQLNEHIRTGKARGHARSDEAELRYLDKLKNGVTAHPDNIGNLPITE